MSRIQIDVATLSAVPADRSRTDGLNNQLVTLTSLDTATTHLIRLVNTTDASPPSLTNTGTTTWTFLPVNGPNTYVFECITDLGLSTESRTRRVYAIRATNTGCRYPGPNEKADPDASIQNSGSVYIAASEDNEAANYLGWSPAMQEWLRAVDALQGDFDAVTGANIGAGSGVFGARSGNTLNFKTLVASTNVTITAHTSTLTIASTASGGGTVTLDTAYDGGGSGAGRTITVDSGAVAITASSYTAQALDVTGYIGFPHTSTVIGGGAHTLIGTNATVVGSGARANNDGTMVGYAGSLAGTGNTGIGAQISAAHNGCILLGRAATSSAHNQLMAGNSTYYISDAVIGGGATSSTARSLSLRTTDASGTNIAGWDLTLSAGRPTGTGAPGAIALAVGDQGTSSGSTLTTQFDAFRAEPDQAYGMPLRFQSGSIHTPLRMAQVAQATAGTTATIATFDFSSISVDSHGHIQADVTGRSDTDASSWNSFKLMAKLTVSSGGAPTIHTSAANQVIWEDSDITSTDVAFTTSGGTVLLQVTSTASESWKWHATVTAQLGG